MTLGGVYEISNTELLHSSSLFTWTNFIRIIMLKEMWNIVREWRLDTVPRRKE
jgi:hypothetical protein